MIDEVDEYLHYLIRFQNTGNAPAINIRVDNVLEPNLNWTSLEIDKLSHPCRVEIKNENEVSFHFDDIFLPDSTTNEPASNGYIAYRIKPNNSLVVGDSIQNKADIYFDFNLPIETNTAITKIVEPTIVSTPPKIRQLNFSIAPVPTSDYLIIQTEATIARIEIYNRLGQLAQEFGGINTIDISHLNDGIYFCKVIDDSGNAAIKKIIKN